ncbi:MAG TPA: S8 family serine peptidase [Pyrinomonadaceae bacterium]|nr:S8 family serine peptidase [Pyrinomonadaceae bacterium]
MYSFRYGGKKGRRFSLATSDEHVVVRTCDRSSLLVQRPFEAAPVSAASRLLLADFELAAEFREAGVEVLRTKVARGARGLRDRTRAALKKENSIQFAGRVLVDPNARRPVIYTENFFVKFAPDVSTTACKKLIKKYGLTVKRELEYARNAYFIQAPEDTGLKVFDIAVDLLNEPNVELCHPELIREARRRQVFPNQWHLKKMSVNGQVIDQHANVEAAWALSDGAGATIAVIDDGVDLDHDEFRSSAKIVAPRDVTRKSNDPRPGNRNNHGTACAGVACADGNFGASGVAPRARLIPIRLASQLGSQNEADAFVWAAQNGADVISCSWGPEDGDYSDPDDPIHGQVVAIPDSTRLAIDFAVNNGRNGKGCVVCFAAGNGNESVDNDGYASYEKVIAVAASNDRGKKAAYSDFGGAVWCTFPSNNGFPSLTPGIWTTDRSGAVGYNLGGGTTLGDTAGNYTNDFGGTSSACPGVAGVAALVLARNPALRWDEVRDILKRSCDRIDTAGGQYDSTGRSRFYGYGRVNAKRAVELAMPAQPSPVAIRTIVQDVAIKDLQTATLSLPVADAGSLKSIKVIVDIEHTYRGDLVVSVKPPAATGVSAIVLHDREGGGVDNLKKTYDEVNAPGLVGLKNKSPKGTWTLSVADKEKQDTGKIKSFSIEMRF